jgi:hypothetical protein
MQNYSATVVNRKQKSKEILLWFISIILFFVTMMVTLLYFLTWHLLGAICAIVLLPLATIVYPFLIIFGNLGNGVSIGLSFLLVVATFTLLLNVYTFTNEGHSFFYFLSTHAPFHQTVTRIRHFYGWTWLFWTEILAYAILYVLSPVYVLFGPFREFVYNISLKSKMWAKDHPIFFVGILFLFYLEIAFMIPVLVYQYLGKAQLFDGIVGAIAIIAFIALQFQNVTPPFFVPTFLNSQSSSPAKGSHKIIARPSEPTWITICIINLGITTFKDCVFQVTFPEGFCIQDDPNLYKDKDYSKTFKIRNNKTIIEFLPPDNYMTFAPCTNLIFPMCILTPKDTCEYQIVATLTSESAWGAYSKPLYIYINDK